MNSRFSRHVQTITTGLQRAAPGSLDYCVTPHPSLPPSAPPPLLFPSSQFGYIGHLSVGETCAFCLALNLHPLHTCPWCHVSTVWYSSALDPLMLGFSI